MSVGFGLRNAANVMHDILVVSLWAASALRFHASTQRRQKRPDYRPVGKITSPGSGFSHPSPVFQDVVSVPSPAALYSLSDCPNPAGINNGYKQRVTNTDKGHGIQPADYEAYWASGGGSRPSVQVVLAA